MASPAVAIANALGGTKLLGRQVRNVSDLADMIREGLPTASVRAISQRLALDQADAAATLGIAPRTLSRRLSSQNRLTAIESDRTVRVARVFSTAVAMIGDEAKAVTWLHTPNRALGGAKPLAQLDTEPSAAEVENVLGRIAYGGYS